ncbi:MAG: 2,3-bisphosphoglycerate-independent phosphoglycerate mutase, partial [Gammaproteobacteria bacterium]
MRTLNAHLPMVLIILDGFGYRQDKEHNAIAAANKPHWDELIHHYPHMLIEGAGSAVGLPEGQMGNSEVGHLNLGAGRTIYQDFTRIEHAIEDGSFFKNSVLLNALETAKEHQSAVHIIGLMSPGGVHSHEDHIHALSKLAAKQGIQKLYLHAFLDGRDTPPKSALSSLEKTEDLFRKIKTGQFASIVGRYYAMDRDKRWDRTHIAYELITEGKAPYSATSASEA